MWDENDDDNKDWLSSDLPDLGVDCTSWRGCVDLINLFPASSSSLKILEGVITRRGSSFLTRLNSLFFLQLFRTRPSVHKRREGRRREEAGIREKEESRRRQRRSLLSWQVTSPEFEVQGVLTESGCSLESVPPRGSLKSQTMIFYYFRTTLQNKFIRSNIAITASLFFVPQILSGFENLTNDSSSSILSLLQKRSAPEGVVVKETEDFTLILLPLLPAVTLPGISLLTIDYVFFCTCERRARCSCRRSLPGLPGTSVAIAHPATFNLIKHLYKLNSMFN